MNNFTLNISSDWVSWYGAIVATIAVGVSSWMAWRDRAKIKIGWQKDMRLTGDLNHDPEQPMFVITVINLGRRSVKIGNVSIRLYSGGYLLSVNSIYNPHGQNRVLNEKNPQTQYFMEQDEMNFDNCWYILVADGFGREHKKYFHLFSTVHRIIALFKKFFKK